ncbi:hypothetical protein [Actinomadura litoris]|uniref:hypothetical protein n=1 Tax=Actinomadura litoris TaxID=2678616 RepID=UPI001FA7EF0C|nr:hypothetical protein [Actinomadura litoris]
MVVWSFPPFPDDAVAGMDGADRGEAEAARQVLVPSEVPPVLPRAWTARRLLNRLARALHQLGWRVERRDAKSVPILRVYFPKLAGLGDSVTVVREDGEWWYRSSTGELLASCTDVELAVTRVRASQERLVAAADSLRRTDGA